MDGARGLPVSSAVFDCTVTLATGELIPTWTVVVEGSVMGTVTITGVLVLREGDSIIKSFCATNNLFSPTSSPSPLAIRLQLRSKRLGQRCR